MLVLGVLAIVALGVVLRFVCRSDLWADEALSVGIARLPVDHLLPRSGTTARRRSPTSSSKAGCGSSGRARPRPVPCPAWSAS